MKINMYFAALCMLTSMFLVFSCSKDDAQPEEEEEEMEEEEENPDNPDGQELTQDSVLSANYLALKALYQAKEVGTHII